MPKSKKELEKEKLKKKLESVQDQQRASSLAIEIEEEKQDKEKIEKSLESTQKEYETKIKQKALLMLGRIQATSVISKMITVAELVWIKEIKDLKLYVELPNIHNWGDFCNLIGVSTRKIDTDIQNLNTFGQLFMENAQKLKIGYRDLSKLRKVSVDEKIEVKEDALIVSGEKIPLKDKEEMQIVIEKLLETKQEVIDEKEVTLKAKERVIKAKDDVIKKQEKEISRYESGLGKSKFSKEEEAFKRDIENWRLKFEGYFLKVDPAREVVPPDATDLMKSSYFELIAYMKRMFDNAYNIALQDFGTGEENNEAMGWKPPEQKELTEEEMQEKFEKQFNKKEPQYLIANIYADYGILLDKKIRNLVQEASKIATKSEKIGVKNLFLNRPKTKIELKKFSSQTITTFIYKDYLVELDHNNPKAELIDDAWEIIKSQKTVRER